MLQHHLSTSTVEETRLIAATIAAFCYQYCDDNGFLITLEGQLGAGKTAFSQGFIQSLLPNARVRSPTFSLIESYTLEKCAIHHLDLYRLQDVDELEYLGIRDLFWHNICLIEWASRGEGWLAPADLAITIQVCGQNREIALCANTLVGEKIIEQLMNG
ncbi:MAG: tRNA (adenosine(37)-N6)-threonylcarbamoyltransferase complex ATPase subunit type 1 TsaE [Proteobacteria bacterium]|nr:tRNA (adenosine(37)-N6)-threonylcarbamoyltransferase complex ATPase subunit type 1 TsaE [Pseudomonadota bacterium]